MAEKEEIVEFDYASAQTVFTDVVEISVRNDVVCFAMGLRDREGKTAKVSHRVFMTLSHFTTFSVKCTEIGENIKAQIEFQIRSKSQKENE